MLSTVLMKLLTVKAAATAAVVTTVAGGVAAASVTMATQPDALQVSQQAGVAADASPSARASRKHDGTRGKDGDRPDAKAGAGRSTGPGGAAGSPSPSLVGLCHAVRVGNKADHGRALQSPAFRVLVTTAGGTDRVDAFCTALLASGDKPDKVHPSNPATADDGETGIGTSGDDKPALGRGNGRPDQPGSGKAGSDNDKSGSPRPDVVLSDVPAGP